MTFSDAKFLNPLPVADEPRPDYARALAGVGDKLRRAAGDFFTSFTGTPLPPHQDSGFEPGDTVEYTTPDGVHRVGELESGRRDNCWNVRVDEGLVHIVPQTELRPSLRTPRHAYRSRVQAALRRTSSWSMRRRPEPQNDGTVLLTVDVGHGKVAEDEVTAFAQREGYAALDAAREGGLLRIVAQEQPKPSEPTGGEEPGLESEEIQGTGIPHSAQVDPSIAEPTYEYKCKQCGTRVDDLDAAEHDKCPDCGASDPWREAPLSFWAQLQSEGYELGAVFDEGHKHTRRFTVPHRYVTPRGKVTAKLQDGVAPLSGYFEYYPAANTLRKFVYTAEGAIEMPYASGTGPESVRENEDAEDGDYIVKAKGDEKAKKYYKKLWGPAAKHVRATFERVAGRPATDDEVAAMLRVVAYGPRTVRTAQMTSGVDIVNDLMTEARDNPKLRAKLNSLVIEGLSSNPAKMLNAIDSTVYPRIIFTMLQQNERKVTRLHKRYVDRNRMPSDTGKGRFEDEPSTTPLGDPELPHEPELGELAPQQEQQPQSRARQQPQQQPQQPAQAQARQYLMRKAPEFKDMEPRAQDFLIKQLLQDPPPDFAPTAPKRSASAQVRAAQALMQARLDRLSAQGSYLCARVVWDPDDCAGMSDGNIRHAVVTWLKGVATRKEEFPDLGVIGRPRFKSFDPDAGIAELLVRSSEGKNFPQEVMQVEGKDNDTRA